MTGIRSSAFAALLPLLLVGCAQNSIFEMTIVVEPAPETAVNGDLRDRVLIEARSGMADFGADWQQTQITGIVLADVPGNTFVASFEASGDQIEEILRVKVRFCADPRCTSIDAADGAAPELHYEFERAFYRGRYTMYEATITDFPDLSIPGAEPPQSDVGKCDIVGEGCWEGMTDFNCLSDGRHFCEDN